jgi:hypothetical protein
MTLSKSLGSFSLHSIKPSMVHSNEIKKQLFDVHREMVRFVAKSFLPRSKHIKDRLPSPAEYHFHFD